MLLYRLYIAYIEVINMEGKRCTFFGHRDCPEGIRPKIQQTVVDLVENHGVTMFYVGNQGNFDRLVRSVLKETERIYPNVRYAVVLAYMPFAGATGEAEPHTILPEGIEKVPKRFAILWRNKWMLERAEYVVTYVTHPWGGAARFQALARKQGKRVVELTVL